MKRPLFPTTLSILSYDIGKSVGLRTYQQPLVRHWGQMLTAADAQRTA